MRTFGTEIPLKFVLISTKAIIYLNMTLSNLYKLGNVTHSLFAFSQHIHILPSALYIYFDLTKAPIVHKSIMNFPL